MQMARRTWPLIELGQGIRAITSNEWAGPGIRIKKMRLADYWEISP